MDNSTQYDKIISDFFQVFSGSISQTLSQNLDADACPKISFEMISASINKNIEDLKETNSIYQLDYAINSTQGSLIVLIPEELIAVISDVLTGGNGKEAYKGSLSEIETNSISKILEKVFKHIEGDFKKSYSHDLVFSSNPKILLKEMPEYQVNTDDYFFDFAIVNKLMLSEEKEFKITVLINTQFLNALTKELGISSSETGIKHNEPSQLTIDRLGDVSINITAELGRTRVPIKYALELVRGSLVELDTINNSDIKVFANGVEFAYAQVVAIEENFGLKITKIIPPEERLEKI